MAAPEPAPPLDSGVSGWFARELQPHEPALRSYLRARFPNVADPSDIVQETYTRLLKLYAAERSIRCPRALLFTTARNIALDLLRHQRVLPMQPVTDSLELPVIEDEATAPEIIDQHYEFEILAEAVRALPERCRQVIMLRYVDNLPYKEIAIQLGISPETVKVHVAKGIRRCTEYFVEHGLKDPTDSR